MPSVIYDKSQIRSFMLSVIMLNVIVLVVFMLSVVAPQKS
jgi:hypothetical protein